MTTAAACAARSVHLQCWIGGTWKAVQRTSQNPPRPAGGTTQRVTFRSVRTDRVRLLLEPQVHGVSVGLTELQILGPRGQRIDPTVPGVPAGAHRYEAESAEVTDAHIVAKGVWFSGGYVGNINNPDSSVVFQQVHAATAGRYILGVRYADGLNTRLPTSSLSTARPQARSRTCLPAAGVTPAVGR